MKPKLRIALLLLLIFVGGGFVGWLAGRTSEPPERPAIRRQVMKTAEEVLKEMDASLHLTPEQRERINPLVVEWRKKARGIEATSVKQRHEVFQQMVPIIRTNLTAEQQRTYDRDALQIERRFQRGIRNLSGNP